MNPRFILFTGHRDKKANPDELKRLAFKYPDSIWIHGGAVGFDEQVDIAAHAYGIQTVIVPPTYKNSQDKSAPLRRNDLMVELCDVVVALYDGRPGGGTTYTIFKAKEFKKPIKYLSPI